MAQLKVKERDINEAIRERIAADELKSADRAVIAATEQSVDNSTGFVRRETAFSADVFAALVTAGQTMPPWWSYSRDMALSRFWKKSNHLSIAVYNAQAKLVGIPLTVVARDPTNDVHVAEADALTYRINTISEFSQGWNVAYSKFVEDLLTQDNGAFMEITGNGPPGGPIFGTPTGVRHLDSGKCQRTADPIWPVLYRGEDDRLYKMHFTRIIHMAQMPSARRDMHGVGFCAVSRAMDIAQNLLDMVIYKQERLGSRPPNQILIGKGVTGEQIMEALYQANLELDDMGHSKYARTVAIGSENPDIGLERVDMNHMEPFDEETMTMLGMFAIAGAFGLDAGEIWPAPSGSSNKADAALRRLRSRGKLPAHTTADLETQMNFKVVPPHLMVRFDFQDDEEDMQRANIRDIRGRNRERDIGSGTISVSTARQQMVMDGDLDRHLFEIMEMEDGRLPDGSSIGILFFQDDPIYQRYLQFSDMEPLVVADNDPEEALAAIQRNKQELYKEWANTRSARKKETFLRANSALTWLEQRYEAERVGPIPEVPMQGRRLNAGTLRMTRIDGKPEEGAPDDEQQMEERNGV